MIRISPTYLACTTLLAVISVARAGTINFTGLADGTVVNNQYAGVVFSLQGGPESSGPPTTWNYSVEALGNSDTSGYPTANILNMAFTSPVTGLSFTFDNYGTGAPTFYTAFDALDNVIATANISSVQDFGLITVAGTGVADLQINNGQSPTDNWYFGVGELTFTPLTGTPEPGSLTLLGSALVGLAVVRRSKRKAA